MPVRDYISEMTKAYTHFDDDNSFSQNFMEYGDVEDRLYHKHVEPNRIRQKDKSDIATHQKVVNDRLMRVLQKLKNKGVLKTVYGEISTGKEASVHHGISGEGFDVALKIFKVEVLDYKNRSRYMEGEFRFRKWNYSNNPRKMVLKWAEKEFRNLNRLMESDIPCPQPICLKDSVIIMSFLGENGVPYPKLKDVDLESPFSTFKEIIILIRRMFHQAKLVHADLSEYNILHDPNNSKSYIIDVSQAVECRNVKAIEYLKHDLINIIKYFSRYNDFVASLQILFQNVIDPDISQEKVEKNLDDHFLSGQGSTEQENRIFLNSYIPTNLGDIKDPEREIEKLKNGDKEEILYTTLLAKVNGICISEQPPESEHDETSSDEQSERVAPLEEDVPTEASSVNPKELRKINKLRVKEENRTKRQKKMPKHIKKRAEKVSSRKRFK